MDDSFAQVTSTALGSELRALMDADDLRPGDTVSYVYLWFYPDGRPLYVGKGTWRSYSQRQRWNDLERNRAFNGVLRKAGGSLPVVVVRDGLTHQEAFALESNLIKVIGRKDLGTGPLVNLTDGGDGGTNPSLESRQKMSRAGLGRVKSADHRRKIGDSNRGLKKSSERYREAQLAIADQISLRMTSFHSEMSEDQKRARATKISAATKAGMLASGASAKISAARAAKPLSLAQHEVLRRMTEASRQSYASNPEMKARVLAKLNASSKFAGKRHTEETKAKMRASHRRRLEALRERTSGG